MSSHKAMFNSVVENALDFLKQSILELKKSPKYSVIHFCAAIELFLKARLMLEHWTLIVGAPEKANLVTFARGDFVSVAMDEAIRRLQAVIGEELSKPAQKCLKSLRDHRNKLVHFFNSDYVGDVGKTKVTDIVVEQLRAWYYLHQLLQGRWASEFMDYKSVIEGIHRQMLKRRSYLRMKFDTLKQDIAKCKIEGATITRCLNSSCRFKSAKEGRVLGPLYTSQCLVCEQEASYLRIPCAECEKETIFCGEGDKCKHCGANIELDYLVDKYCKYRHDDPDAMGSIFCTWCECTEASVVEVSGQWLCLSCLETFEASDTCDWCNEHWAGSLSNSNMEGCGHCDGWIGHIREKDD